MLWACPEPVSPLAGSMITLAALMALIMGVAPAVMPVVAFPLRRRYDETLNPAAGLLEKSSWQSG